jgi:hypothetical protein
MNQHLNIFRFYNESSEREFIENNLSRAFAICLTNNSLFLYEYIKLIVTADDFDYLFSSIGENEQYSIDIQIDTATLEKVSYSKVYAVAMTTDKHLDMADFFSQPDFGEKKNITDIIISIKDIAIIIEVKRTGEDCKAQLFNQVLPFIKENFTVVPVKHSWQETIKLLEKINHLQILSRQHSVFISDFLQLSEIRFPEWFEPKPFNVLPFSNQLGTTKYNQSVKRMRQALASSKYELLGYYDRLGVSVPFGWASEIIPEFQYYENSKDKEYVTFYIWPGNTKQQGYHIFNNTLDWYNKSSLTVRNKQYKIEIAFAIKLCHFNRYVSGINFYPKDISKPIHTADNFYNKSGKWNRDSWTELEGFFDKHFNPDFDWRSRCGWVDNFLNTDRNYLTMSIGYEVCMFIPYSEFKHIDKTETDIKKLSDFINDIADSYKKLLD